MLRLLVVTLIALTALCGPAACSENPATVSRNERKGHVAALRPPAEVIVDDNGNLTDDGTRLFFYDYKNRLVGVSERASGNPVASYEYLADGRRAKKVVYSQTAPGQVQKATCSYWDGAQEVEEQDAGSGATEATYVWSPVYVDELVTYTNAAGTFYTHQDARCDVVAITDAAGNVVERVRYDDFGMAEIRGPGGEVRAVSAVGCAYGFQGRRLDAETGLLYFRARMYDLATGRFLQRDPVWDAGNVGGQYTFVGNGPLSGRDPSGLMNDPGDSGSGAGWGKARGQGSWSPSGCGGGGGGLLDAIGDLALEDFRTMAKAVDAPMNEFESGSALVGSVELVGAGFMAVDVLLSVVTGGTKEIPAEAAEQLLKKATKEVTEKLARDKLARETAEAAAKGGDNLIYRALREGEDPSQGLHARTPGAGTEPSSHIMGKKESDLISGSKSEQIVRDKFDSGNGIVEIDLNKVPNEVIDVSQGIGEGRVYTRSKGHQEVLIRDSGGGVPADAVRLLEPGSP